MENIADYCPKCRQWLSECKCPYVPDTPAELLGRFVLAAFIAVFALGTVAMIFAGATP